jgi:DNA replication protein DnaC
MNKQILENIMTEYNKKRLKAAHDADLRKQKLYGQFPDLEEIEMQIKLLSIKLSKLFLTKPDNLNEQVLNFKNEIEELKNKRRNIYEKNNIPANYLEIQYECNKCNDTGYLPDGKKMQLLK